MTPDLLAQDGTLAAFADGALGGGLPAAAQALIAQATAFRHLPAKAQALLEAARAAAPAHPAPLIALYRFHFYGHRLRAARGVAEDALAVARFALGSRFGDEPPARDAVRDDAAVRFYLFTLRGLAYLSLRLGEPDEARTALRELRRLDPEDDLGGALLQHVLARHEADGDPEAEARLVAHPVRGWPKEAA